MVLHRPIECTALIRLLASKLHVSAPVETGKPALSTSSVAEQQVLAYSGLNKRPYL
jgi:hypothetical protein